MVVVVGLAPLMAQQKIDLKLPLGLRGCDAVFCHAVQVVDPRVQQIEQTGSGVGCGKDGVQQSRAHARP